MNEGTKKYVLFIFMIVVSLCSPLAFSKENSADPCTNLLLKVVRYSTEWRIERADSEHLVLVEQFRSQMTEEIIRVQHLILPYPLQRSDSLAYFALINGQTTNGVVIWPDGKGILLQFPTNSSLKMKPKVRFSFQLRLLEGQKITDAQLNELDESNNSYLGLIIKQKSGADASHRLRLVTVRLRDAQISMDAELADDSQFTFIPQNWFEGFMLKGSTTFSIKMLSRNGLPIDQLSKNEILNLSQTDSRVQAYGKANSKNWDSSQICGAVCILKIMHLLIPDLSETEQSPFQFLTDIALKFTKNSHAQPAAVFRRGIYWHQLLVTLQNTAINLGHEINLQKKGKASGWTEAPSDITEQFLLNQTRTDTVEPILAFTRSVPIYQTKEPNLISPKSGDGHFVVLSRIWKNQIGELEAEVRDPELKHPFHVILVPFTNKVLGIQSFEMRPCCPLHHSKNKICVIIAAAKVSIRH